MALVATDLAACLLTPVKRSRGGEALAPPPVALPRLPPPLSATELLALGFGAQGVAEIFASGPLLARGEGEGAQPSHA